MQTATLRLVDHADLPGWYQADHQPSLLAFRNSATEILETGAGFQRQPVFGGLLGDWRDVCEVALTSELSARQFFEQHFSPLAVLDDVRPEGLFTGYYEPQAEASHVPHPDFPVPLYQKPHDLVSFTPEETAACGLSYGRRLDGVALPYFSRQQIEQGALKGRSLEFVWLRNWVDAFFIHIQGQGRLHFADGSVMRLAYGGKSGRPYTGIGGVLVSRGEIPPEANSMQSIRAWMSRHSREARELMWENESFVFFREVAVADPEAGSLGAQRVTLTPRRSLAVDRHYWMFGTPLWLESELPPQASAKTFRELMIAQDTGTAIKGAARGDVYWGWGEEAALVAGHMKSPGRLFALLPHRLAARLARKRDRQVT
jgi:membrane-bound lytic murein transglycosylase A